MSIFNDLKNHLKADKIQVEFEPFWMRTFLTTLTKAVLELNERPFQCMPIIVATRTEKGWTNPDTNTHFITIDQVITHYGKLGFKGFYLGKDVIAGHKEIT